MAGHETRLAGMLALAGPALLLGGAYLSQYGFGLHPCEMCWWQRYPHFVAIVLAVLAWLWRPTARPLILLAALAIAASGLIGGFHAGVEYGWWQGLTACSTALPAGGDPLEAIMNAPLVRCDVVPWSLLGISLAGWNFLFSMTVSLAIVLLLARGGKAAG
ncbi:MAG TPA: disulfide bond formation protein B [Novosphingobium sp.]